jgi:hypothetical protein
MLLPVSQRISDCHYRLRLVRFGQNLAYIPADGKNESRDF